MLPVLFSLRVEGWNQLRTLLAGVTCCAGAGVENTRQLLSPGWRVGPVLYILHVESCFSKYDECIYVLPIGRKWQTGSTLHPASSIVVYPCYKSGKQVSPSTQ